MTQISSTHAYDSAPVRAFKTIGHFGTWPVRVSGRKMKTAASGTASAARKFVSSPRKEVRTWRAAKTADNFTFLTARSAAQTLVDALKEKNYGAMCGALEALNSKCKDNDAAIAEIKDALASDLHGGRWSNKQLEQLYKTDFEKIGRYLNPIQTRRYKAGCATPLSLDIVKEAFRFAADRDKLRTMTDGVLTISDDGAVSGKLVNSRLPSLITDKLPDPAKHHRVNEHTPVTFIETAARENMKKALEKASAGENGAMTEVSLASGQKISIMNSAAGDWHRMDINFLRPEGSAYCTRTADIEDSAAELLALTGSEGATLVLSSVLHQYQLREIVCEVGDADGEKIYFCPCVKGLKHVEVYSPDGSYERFADPKQIGDAKISVKKSDKGDFEVSVDWTYLSLGVERNGVRKKVNPSNPEFAFGGDSGTALKVDLKGSFVISGAEAEKGELKILSGGQFTHEISGMIK